MKEITLYRTFRLCLLATCLISCGMNRTQSSILPVTYKEDVLHSSSVFSHIECIQLTADTSDAIVSHISRILLAPNNLYIIDRSNNKIVAFDRKGRYLSSTSPLIGRATNEYIRINDAAIDTIQHKIYAYCDSPYQILVLDYLLNVIECIKLDELIMECSVDESKFYALCLDAENESFYELRSYDKYNLNNGYEVLLKQNNGIANVRSLGKSLIGDMKNTYVCMPFDSRIFSISNGAITNSWVIDWKDKWFNYETSKKHKGMHFLNANDGLNWFMQNICGSDKALYFNTNKSGIYKVDLQQRKVIKYKDIDNPNVPFSSSY